MMLWSGEDMAVLNFPLDEGGGGEFLYWHLIGICQVTIHHFFFTKQRITGTQGPTL